MTDDLKARLVRIETGDGGSNWHRNPDGPEALARIEALEAQLDALEVKSGRKKDALNCALEYLRGSSPDTTCGGHRNGTLRNRIKIALGSASPLRAAIVRDVTGGD